MFALVAFAPSDHATASTHAKSSPERAALREHVDHRHLPIGTRIYRDEHGGTYYRYPGTPLPPAFRNATPIVVIIR